MTAIIANFYTKGKSYFMTSMSGSVSVTTTATAAENDIAAPNDGSIEVVNNVTATARIVQHTSEFLEYPHDFFDKGNGANPKSNAEAAKLWPFRKNRPPKGLVDQEPADGALMMEEVKAIHQNLREYIFIHYKEDLRRQAALHGLVRLNDNSPLVASTDFKKVIKAMANTEENNRLVWKVFHKPFRHRNWLACLVDKWFIENKMIFLKDPARGTNQDEPNMVQDGQEMPLPRVGVKKGRQYTDVRGGFGAVARGAKAEEIGKFMTPMFATTGWYVASVDRGGKGLKYTESLDEQGDKFYVITKQEGAELRRAPASKKVILFGMHALLSSAIYDCVL